VDEVPGVIVVERPRRLDLHPDHATVAGFEDAIDLDTVPGAEVEQTGAGLAPADLAGQLGQDEVLEERTEPGGVTVERPGRYLGEVGAEAGIDEQELGLGRGPGRG